MTSHQLHCSRSIVENNSFYVERIPPTTKIQLRRGHAGRRPQTSACATETVCAPQNTYSPRRCDLHNSRMTCHVSTSVGTRACRGAVASKS
jgi:hypothetical protein